MEMILIAILATITESLFFIGTASIPAIGMKIAEKIKGRKPEKWKYVIVIALTIVYYPLGILAAVLYVIFDRIIDKKLDSILEKEKNT